MARIRIDDLEEPSVELDDTALDAVVGGSGGSVIKFPSGYSLTPGGADEPASGGFDPLSPTPGL